METLREVVICLFDGVREEKQSGLEHSELEVTVECPSWTILGWRWESSAFQLR